MFNKVTKTFQYGQHTVTLETGEIARQASGAVVVSKFLTSAIDYYCNADEVGVSAKCSGDRRLRVQGKVEEGSLDEGANGSVESFVVSFNGAEVPVDYSSGQSLRGRTISASLPGETIRPANRASQKALRSAAVE